MNGQKADMTGKGAAITCESINFHIGGEVNVLLEPRDSSIGGSIVNLLKPYDIADSGTSLDLDNVQPPSEMDGISYMAKMDSPQLSSLRNRKGLASGIIAKRAIASTQGGHLLNHHHHHHHSQGQLMLRSAESIVSNTNLDNIAPPSLMDELLDSMISVDSITSELACDHPQHLLPLNHPPTSNYETALSDNEDTVTLQSCEEDLPMDGILSNGSSSTSSPVKRNRMSSPKMKRQGQLDRFRTFTVADGQLSDIDITVQMLPDESTVNILAKSTAKQRRQENRSRFQTQIVDYSDLKTLAVIPLDRNCELSSDSIGRNVAADSGIVDKPIKSVGQRSLIKLNNTLDAPSPSNSDQSMVAVRGRRKPEYISPYRRPMSTGTVTATSKAISRSIPKSIPNIKPSPLNKKSSFISKLSSIKVGVKKVASLASTKKQQSPPSIPEPPQVLKRQGTFTKDEPSREDIPTVSSLPATPVKRPVTKLPINSSSNGCSGTVRRSGTSIIHQNGLAKNNGPSSIRRQISAPTGVASDKRKSATFATSRALSPGTTMLGERSVSTASMRAAINNRAMVEGSAKRLPVSMPTSRSNSNAGTPRTPTIPTPKISVYARNKVMMIETRHCKY